MKNKDILKEYFYYYRNLETNAPVITVCLILNKEGEVAKGLSICSRTDNPAKLEGKRWAKKYAMKAIGSKRTSEPVNNLKAIDILLDTPFYDEINDDRFIFKSIFKPRLTEFDKKLLYNIRENNNDKQIL